MWQGRAAAITAPRAKPLLPLSVYFSGILVTLLLGFGLAQVCQMWHLWQGRLGLFEYSTGSLPSAAGATGRGWLC